MMKGFLIVMKNKKYKSLITSKKWIKSIFTALFLLTIGCIPAVAGIMSVSTASEFQSALREAAINAGDDTIILSAGTYVGEFSYSSTENFSLTIKSEDGLDAGQVVLDGLGMFPVLDLDSGNIQSDYYLKNITFQRTTITYGVSIITNGDVFLDSCVFTSNMKGFLCIKTQGNVKVQHTLITDNTTIGILIEDSNEVTFKYNNINGNGVQGPSNNDFLYLDSINTLIFMNNNLFNNAPHYNMNLLAANSTNNALISGNYIYNNYNAIVLSNSAIQIDFSNNMVINNYLGLSTALEMSMQIRLLYAITFLKKLQNHQYTQLKVMNS